jgi:hypothetical protein
MTSSFRRSSSKSRPGANPAEETAWLDGLLEQISVADVLCEALARALKGADATAMSNTIGAVAARMMLVERDKEEWAFWQNLLELMSANDHVPPSAKAAAGRALRGRYSPNAITFLAECIVEHVSKEVDCNHLTAEGVPTPGDTAVCTRPT